MRLAVLLPIVFLLFAGCAAKDSSESGGPSAAAPSHDAPAGGITTTTTTTTTTSTSHGSATTTGTTQTSQGPLIPKGNATSTKRGLLAHEHFSGSVPAPTTGPTSDCSVYGPVPAPDAVCPKYTLTVPDGATELTMWYNTTYTGLFSADVSINGPDGSSTDTLSACGIPPPGTSVPFSCTVDLQDSVPAGGWVVDVSYQAGEVNESYSIDVSAWGNVPA